MKKLIAAALLLATSATLMAAPRLNDTMREKQYRPDEAGPPNRNNTGLPPPGFSVDFFYKKSDRYYDALKERQRKYDEALERKQREYNEARDRRIDEARRARERRIDDARRRSDERRYRRF